MSFINTKQVESVPLRVFRMALVNISLKLRDILMFPLNVGKWISMGALCYSATFGSGPASLESVLCLSRHQYLDFFLVCSIIHWKELVEMIFLIAHVPLPLFADSKTILQVLIQFARILFIHFYAIFSISYLSLLSGVLLSWGSFNVFLYYVSFWISFSIFRISFSNILDKNQFS